MKELSAEEMDFYTFTEPSTGIFGISFLSNILKIRSIVDITTFYLQSEAPIKIECGILNGSTITYYLAPRVETEDDAYEE